MKKALLMTVFFCLFFAAVPHVLAAPQGFTALAPIPGLTDSDTMSVVNSTSLANFFNNLYKYLIGLAAILAVIEIMVGGFEISTKDSVSKQSNGKERIKQALFGLLLVLSPAIVFSIINPSILNLSLNLPELNTAPAASPATSTQAPASSNAIDPDTVTLTSETECKTITTNEYFETAICPNKDTALAYTCKNNGILQHRIKLAVCANYDPNEKKCLDKYPVFCQGTKQQIVLYYAPASTVKDLLGLNFGENVRKVIPRDASTQEAYSAACRASGGTMYPEMVSSKSLDCPKDAQLPRINQEEGVMDFKCAQFRLVCAISPP